MSALCPLLPLDAGLRMTPMLLAFSVGICSYNRKKTDAKQGLAERNAVVFNRAHSHTYGPSIAKVRITEFFDPACKTCRAFYPMVKRLVDAEQGRMQLVVRFFSCHDGSGLAAKILVATDAQKLLLPVTSRVLSSQESWASHINPKPELIWSLLRGTGLDIPRAQAYVSSANVQAVIDQNLMDAKTLQMTKTPGFFVNGKLLENFGYDQLKTLVQQALQLAYPQ